MSDAPQDHLRHIAALENALKEKEDQLNRLYQRHHQELEIAFNDGRTEAVTSILEVLDDFHRVLMSVGSLQGRNIRRRLQEGLELSFRKADHILQQAFDITPVDDANLGFNPALMEAIAVEHTSDVPRGTIIEIPRRGYVRGSKLVRPAQVVVAMPCPETEGGSIEEPLIPLAD